MHAQKLHFQDRGEKKRVSISVRCSAFISCHISSMSETIFHFEIRAMMRNVLCQDCNNILWQIPCGLASCKCVERVGERDESSGTKWPSAAPTETYDPIHSTAGSGSNLWLVKNRKLSPFKPGEVWLTEECASVFFFSLHSGMPNPWIPEMTQAHICF